MASPTPFVTGCTRCQLERGVILARPEWLSNSTRPRLPAGPEPCGSSVGPAFPVDPVLPGGPVRSGAGGRVLVVV
jgi:hypothetical protein